MKTKQDKFFANRPTVAIDLQKLRQNGVSECELRRYFPRYILNPTELRYGRMKRIGLLLVQWVLRIIVKVFLKPRQSSGSLEQSEVDEVYTKEAHTYNWKHHLTTRGMDLVWRRAAGWFLASITRNHKSSIKAVDLCTGTGLTAREMISIAREWGVDVNIIGLDYNARMIAEAERTVSNEKVQFVQGDATDLLRAFTPCSVDIATQVFGIGGIPEPLKVFEGVLQILKPSSQFLMIDMHKPIPEYPGEWPFFLKWCRFPILEMVTYEDTTIPLVLNRLWGWRDTTLCFYLLPLITYKDDRGRYWGFEIKSFEQESQRWWFALPLMPIGKIVVEKTEISEEIAKTRKAILEDCVKPQ